MPFRCISTSRNVFIVLVYTFLVHFCFQEFLHCPSLYLQGAFLPPGISLLSKFILSRCISTSRNFFIVLVYSFPVHFYFQEFLHCPSLYLPGAFLLPEISLLSKFILSRCISNSRNFFIVQVYTFSVHFYFQEFLYCPSLYFLGAFLLPGISSLS